MKSMNIPPEKMHDYKHGDVRSRAFITSKRFSMTELATIVYLMNCMSQKVGLWFNLNEKLTF